jgi:pantoate--beta-alanine ligase
MRPKPTDLRRQPVRTLTTIIEMREAVRRAKADGRSVALVPTLGALHTGHLPLVRRAAAEADVVVVSVFVNPTQFDRAGDFATYPRDLAADVEALASLGDATPAIVFAPSVEEMYPREPVTRVQVGVLTDRLCGATRPGHFDGVATVVTKLLAITTPDLAVFGRKDRQQLAVVERLVADLDLGVRIVGVTTVRDDDGVAASSRNALLPADGRAAARGLSQALAAGLEVVREARREQRRLVTGDIVAVLRATMEAHDGLRVDYAEVVDPATMQPPTGPVDAGDPLVLAVAGFVGEVRLIDNIEAGVADDERSLEAATPRRGV